MLLVGRELTGRRFGADRMCRFFFRREGKGIDRTNSLIAKADEGFELKTNEVDKPAIRLENWHLKTWPGFNARGG